MIIIKTDIIVIVPIYNSERYIERCVNSIINQTYSYWKMILIDDGSKDKSLDIIKKYEKTDKRIKVIHQENQGAGAARNTGIDYIYKKDYKNKYLVFVDSDDYIENNYFELLSLHNEDVVFIDVLQRDTNGNVLKKELMSKYSNQKRDSFIRKQMTGYIPWGGVRKAVKTNLIFDNNIRFSKCKIGEEAIYSFWILEKASNIGFINVPVYNYELHQDSLSSSKCDDPWGETYDNLKIELKKNKLYDKYSKTLNSFNITSTLVSIDKISKHCEKKEINSKLKDRKKIYEIRNNNCGIDISSLNYKSKILFPLIIFKYYLPIKYISIFRNKLQKNRGD